MSAESAASALSIPTIVWSGIVAALISLAGVILSNRSSIERLREQLRHDAREKHRDRISELRKQVYLELTTQMMRAQAYLGSLAARDPTSDDFAQPLQDAISELAKVQLVGARESAAIAAELTAVYGEALLKLLGAAKSMHERKIDIKIAGDMYDQQFTQAQRVITEMTALRESGSLDQTKMSALQTSFEHYRSQYTEYSEERNAAWESYNSDNKKFVKVVLEEVKRIAPLQIKLTCAIRSEVGLDTDISELQIRLDSNQARATKAIDDLLAQLDEPAER